jgi:UDP-N-acetylmuramate-alanine ligase
VPDFPGARQILDEVLQDGDLLLTLGAGDVWKVGADFLK